MVCRLGMSEKLGPVAYGRDNQQVFLGRDFHQEERNYSESTAREIDSEVRRIIEEASTEASEILMGRRTCLDHLAQILLEREVMQGSELEELIQKELCCAEGDKGDGGSPGDSQPAS